MTRWIAVSVGILAICGVTQAAEPPSAARKTPLITLGRGTAAVATIDVGDIRIGESTGITLDIRNAGAAPIAIARITSSSGAVALAPRDGTRAPIEPLVPGAAMALRLLVNTRPYTGLGAAVLPITNEFREEVRIYADGEAVHAVALLSLRGRLVFRVAFSPERLDFGKLAFGVRTARAVQAVYAAGEYVRGRTRLVASAALPVEIVESGRPAHLPGNRIRITYEVSVAKDAPIGALGGWLAAKGTATEPGRAASSAADRIPVAGAVVGRLAAEPGMIVFGAPPTALGESRPGAGTDAYRLRWVLLLLRGSAALHRNLSARDAAPPGGAWTDIRATADAPGLDLAIVPPLEDRSARSTSGGLRAPPLFGTGLRPERVRWLRVAARPGMFVAASRPGWVQVSNGGERLRIPVLWPPVRAGAPAPVGGPPRR